MAEKPVTEKLEKMQIKVADAEQRRTQLEVDLQNIKNKFRSNFKLRARPRAATILITTKQSYKKQANKTNKHDNMHTCVLA